MSARCAARSRAGPNSHLRPSTLVVGVRVAVLVQAGVAFEQRGGERLGELRGDHREVERQAVLGEAGDQLQQALVLPAGVVVAEEDLDRLSGFVERK